MLESDRLRSLYLSILIPGVVTHGFSHQVRAARFLALVDLVSKQFW
jgi:hypothetical protein